MAISTINIDGTFPLNVMVLDTASKRSSKYRFGVRSVPSLSVTFTYGSGSGQVNKIYTATRTLAATTYDNLDLAGSLLDLNNAAITFTKIKLAMVAIYSPDGTKKLRVGPSGQSNTFNSGFGNASDYKDVYYWDLVVYEPVTGLTVTAGTGDVFPVYNPTGSSIDYEIILAGV